MTIKIISTDIDGIVTVCLCSGDSIRHTEKTHPARETKGSSDSVIVGGFGNMNSEQIIITSEIEIFDKDNSLIRRLVVTPKSECFIMNDDGKTVDVFYSHVQEPSKSGNELPKR